MVLKKRMEPNWNKFYRVRIMVTQRYWSEQIRIWNTFSEDFFCDILTKINVDPLVSVFSVVAILFNGTLLFSSDLLVLRNPLVPQIALPSGLLTRVCHPSKKG
jgi:hypothetical protein